MRKQNDTHTVLLRDKERQVIDSQVQEFLRRGGKIEVIGSAFDGPQDPKCRLSDDLSLSF